MVPAPLLATVTWADAAVFAVGAVIILTGALGVILMRNPVHSALMLVMTLFGVALLFIEQNAQFLAAVQVIVYAGAIVVLFLFVIMFLGVDREENIEAEPLKGQRPLALVLVGVAFAAIVALGVSAKWVTGAHAVSGHHPGTNVAQIGRSVFTTYLFAFEATAALLVIAVVGAVVLARRPSEPATDDDAEVDAEVDDGGDMPPEGIAAPEENAVPAPGGDAEREHEEVGS
jgi:NADH-quinone oxidoreductase subunit J